MVWGKGVAYTREVFRAIVGRRAGADRGGAVLSRSTDRISVGHCSMGIAGGWDRGRDARADRLTLIRIVID